MDRLTFHYEDEQLDDFIQCLEDNGLTYKKPFAWKSNYGANERIGYLNVPCAFDTETTSITIRTKIKYKNKKAEQLAKIIKTGFMYVWMLGFMVNGRHICISGRSWYAYKQVLKRLGQHFRLGESKVIQKGDVITFKKRLLIFVHNLAFDLQFFRKEFHIDDIFINDLRSPLKAIIGDVEYRCSYQMTGESLATVGKNLVKYKCEKMVGDLDYNLCRNSMTTLSDKEWGYCWNDICVQMCRIQELLDDEPSGKIQDLPLTSTGFVRRDVRNAVLSNDKVKRLVQGLKLTLEEYKMWKQCFQGGFCHGNIFYSGVECEDVTSMDFTSSYPAVMLSEMFPMSNGEKIDIHTVDEIYEQSKSHIIMFRIEFNNIRLRKGMADAPISKSKCEYCHNEPKDNDNGKVRRAKDLCLVCTNVSFDIIDKFYKYDSYTIGTCYSYQTGYLPKEIGECILNYYEQKTTLKGVLGKEIEYLGGKKKVNSIFGMMVMDVIREIFGYEDDEWLEPRKPTDDEEIAQLEKYNNDHKRFNWYPWGCMITEYARYNLLTGIYELGMDYIYADTDSVKINNFERHREYFEAYNELITYKLKQYCKYYDIDTNRLHPKTIDKVDKETGEIIPGVEKPLGVWDFDGHYKKFKFLHSKCYIGDRDDDPKDMGLHCTVAGIAKNKIKESLERDAEEYGTTPFVLFSDDYWVNANDSGKLAHHYCDDRYIFNVMDYQGNIDLIVSNSGVCLEKIPFKLNVTEDYQNVVDAFRLGAGE